MILRAAVLSLAFGASTAMAQAKPPATETAFRFYTVYLKSKIEGLPTPAQRRQLAPLLSPRLLGLLDAARKEQAAFIKAHPDEKPPWIEGDLFSSLFERAQAFELGPQTADAVTARVPVNLRHTDSGKTSKWTDTVVVAQTGGKWLIADIRFGGNWDFKPGPSLIAALESK